MTLADWCGDYHFPEPGGLLDQDYALMRRMRVVKNVRDTVATVENMKGKDIHKMTNSQRRVVKLLRDEGYW